MVAGQTPYIANVNSNGNPVLLRFIQEVTF